MKSETDVLRSSKGNTQRSYRELLGDIKGIRLNENGGNSESNHAYFPIVVNEEFPCTHDELYERLLSSDIAAGRRFYPLATSFKCFQGKFDTIETPVAKEISEQVLLLPLYADLRDEDIEKVCCIIDSIYLLNSGWVDNSILEKMEFADAYCSNSVLWYDSAEESFVAIKQTDKEKAN